MMKDCSKRWGRSMRTDEQQCLSMNTVLTVNSRSDVDDLRIRYERCCSLTALWYNRGRLSCSQLCHAQVANGDPLVGRLSDVNVVELGKQFVQHPLEIFKSRLKSHFFSSAYHVYSHSYASTSDSTLDYWRYINTWLTLTLSMSKFDIDIDDVDVQRYNKKPSCREDSRPYCLTADYLHCVSKKGPTLKRYSSKLYGSILMIFGGNIQKSLE